MILTTSGLVLRRQPYREYDERILFYTEKLGKVWIYSFGSQSSRSLRGQSLAELGWNDLMLEKKNNRYLLKEVKSHLPPDYQRNKEYFMDWSEFLKMLGEKIPGGIPTPKIYSLLHYLSGRESAKWNQVFRKFTWYFMTLIEWGVFPNFSHCCQCGEYCSDWYFFLLPGEIVGVTCISKTKNIRENWLEERLALEDVYFLNYCHQQYSPHPDFFNKIFALAGELSTLPTDPNPNPHIYGKRVLSIHWKQILSVLQTILHN